MRFAIRARDVPGRLTTGAYILHAGLGKWKAEEAQATGLHATAANAFPFLKPIPAPVFIKVLAGGEIAIGALLLAPVVPGAVAGAALTGFSGSLLAIYARTPAFRKPGSIWPTPAGTGVSKDVWMLGIGLGMLAGSVGRRS